MSYNVLVQGKFQEDRAIVAHIQAMKYAQALNRLVTQKLKHDLSQADVTPNSRQQALINAFQNESTDSAIRQNILDNWLPEVDPQIQSLINTLTRSLSTRTIRYELDIQISEVSSIGSSPEYYSFEKAGKIGISVTVFIDRNREEWLEVRPFRVIVSQPAPMTKFTLYLNDPTEGNPLALNRVRMTNNTQGIPAAGSPRPIVFSHGRMGDISEDVWRERGWVYLGGGRIELNRAAGARGLGQNFHSNRPDSQVDHPRALVTSFPDTNFSGIPYNSRLIGFSQARFGFSQDLTRPDWQIILATNDTLQDANPLMWQSTFLQLFGRADNSSPDPSTEISHTRVISDSNAEILDRYVYASYITPVRMAAGRFEPDGGDLFGAIKRHGPTTYDSVDKSTSTWVEDNLVLSNNFPDFTPIMEDFFDDLPFESSSYRDLTYRLLMSRPRVNSYRTIYRIISTYLTTNQLSLPPTAAASVPEVNQQGFEGFTVYGEDPSTPIESIGDNPTLNMDRRVCYEIVADGENDPAEILKQAFMSETNDFILNNSVIRVVNNNQPITLDNDLRVKSGGTILFDSTVTLGSFATPDNDALAPPPLVILSETGDVVINSANAGNSIYNLGNPTQAYLIALNGEIKQVDQNNFAYIAGGIAANIIRPEQFRAGGSVVYNENLRPQAPRIGVILGPLGGDI